MKSFLSPLATLTVAALAGLAGTADAQSCQVYSESFSSSLGPANLDDGTYKVEWCLDGASVATFGMQPCNGTGALQISGSSQEPILWVYVGDNNCSQVTLDLTYRQSSFTGANIKVASGNDTALNCFESITGFGPSMSTTGTNCQSLSFTTSVAGQKSVYFKFDTLVTSSIFIDDLTVTVEGCDCGGGGTGSGCLTSFEADFGTLNLTPDVCQLFPDLFESCEGVSPPYLTGSTPCGASSDMVMGLGNGGTFGNYSAVVTKCLDLTGYSTPALEFEYYKTSGQLGPKIEARVAGGAWTQVWIAPLQTNASASACYFDCIDLSSYAGLGDVQLRIGAADSSAIQHAFDDIKLLDMPIVAGSFTPYFGTGTAPGNSLTLSGSVTNGSGNGPGIGDRIKLSTTVTGSTGAFTGMSLGASSLPYLDVEILVDLGTLIQVLVAPQNSPGSTTSSVDFDIPPLPQLIGAAVYFQSLRIVSGGFVLSNGLEVKLGC